jgi:thiol:disulfide interchange protein DsbC
MRKLFPVALLVICNSFGIVVHAEDAKTDPRVLLLKKLPAGTKIDDLRPAAIAGLYEYMQGAEVSYITADGKYFVDGSVYDMDSHENITERRRVESRLKLLAAIPESQMIVFSPKNPKYTINIFTDIDCGYCRKLHSEVAEYNKLGVKIRYLSYPRAGPDSDSWHKAQVVWCAADRNDALTKAKAGAVLDTRKVCKDSPVAREYQLGQDIGVHGTPAIVTEGGDYISGYMPPQALVQRLDELKVARR